MSVATGEPTPPPTAQARLLGLVERILERPGGAGTLPVDAPLSELGVSSLKMVSLMLAVEVEFDLSIPQEEITPQNFRSISSIHALVTRLLATRA